MPPTSAAPTATQDPSAALPSTRPARKKRGNYVSKACNECKKRKSRCEGTQPCPRCVKAGMQCTFVSSRSPQRQDDRAEMLRLREKLARLEQRMGHPACGTQPAPEEEPDRDAMDAVPTSRANDQFLEHGYAAGMTTQGNPGSSVLPAMFNDATEQTGMRRDNSFALPREQNESNAGPLLNEQLPGIDGDRGRDLFQAPAENHPSATGTNTSCPMDPTLPEAAESGHLQSTAHYKFNLSLAQRLQRQGSPSQEPFRSSLPTRDVSPVHETVSDSSAKFDPIWYVTREEAVRLCAVYEEEIGISYPFLDVVEILSNVHSIFDVLDAGSSHGFAFAPLHDNTAISAPCLRVVKMVLATALIIESSGSSKLGRALFKNVRDFTRDMIWGVVDVHCITVYTLLAIWEFLADNDLLAWRITGIVARWCLELGLNQAFCIRQMSNDVKEQRMLVRLFWCVHTLDRRWSSGCGLPFIIQDADIDSALPEPDDDVPYLQAMVSFSRMVSTVWYASYGRPTSSLSQPNEEIAYLDYRIVRWWEDLPPDLQLGRGAENYSRGSRRLRVLLHLRKCQLYILLHQQVLHSSARIAKEPRNANAVVEEAKDIIQTLADLNTKTDIYRTQQMCFNHFLALALGVVFLAVSQAPERFAQSVRSEFNTALDLVQSLSTSSFVSKRLWRTVRGLRVLGHNLGVSCEPEKSKDREQVFPVSEDPAMGGFENLTAPDSFDDKELDALFFPDTGVDNLQLTEDMSAIFDTFESQWGDASMAKQQGTLERSQGRDVPSTVHPASVQRQGQTSYSTNATRMLVDMIGMV